MEHPITDVYPCKGYNETASMQHENCLAELALAYKERHKRARIIH